jgi:hypothetical protein
MVLVDWARQNRRRRRRYISKVEAGQQRWVVSDEARTIRRQWVRRGWSWIDEEIRRLLGF